MESILSSGGSNASGDSIGGISGSSGGNINGKSQRFTDTTQNNGVNAEVKKIYQ